MRWTGVLVAGFLALLGCAPQEVGDEEMRRLLKTDEAFARASVEEGAAEAFRLFLTEDALQLPAGGLPVRGRETIYQQMSRAPSSTTLEWEPREGGVARSGDLGFTWGTYRASYVDSEGIRRQEQGKYLNVWEKQEDGTWKVLIDMGNASPDGE